MVPNVWWGYGFIRHCEVPWGFCEFLEVLWWFGKASHNSSVCLFEALLWFHEAFEVPQWFCKVLWVSIMVPWGFLRFCDGITIVLQDFLRFHDGLQEIVRFYDGFTLVLLWFCEELWGSTMVLQGFLRLSDGFARLFKVLRWFQFHKALWGSIKALQSFLRFQVVLQWIVRFCNGF